MFNTNYCNIVFSDTNLYKIYGRTLTDDNALNLSWSNSGIEFKFQGERAIVFFTDYICDKPVFVKVFIDGRPQKFGLCGNCPTIVIECEKDAVHTVKLLRISEGDIYLGFKGVTIYGKAPEFKAPSAEKKFKLEFLGDSITTGWGVCATGEQDAFNTYEQDSTKSYAYMTAELLDAEIRSEAIGGQGIWRNCAKAEGVQFKHMFDMSVRGVENYDHSTWTPDVMILHCGTNDEPGGTTEEEMIREANILLDKVRDVYPDCKIIWMYGMLNSKFKATLKELIDERRRTDKNVYFLPLDLVSRAKNEVGAVGHPNVNASVKVSKKLSKFIIKITK